MSNKASKKDYSTMSVDQLIAELEKSQQAAADNLQLAEMGETKAGNLQQQLNDREADLESVSAALAATKVELSSAIERATVAESDLAAKQSELSTANSELSAAKE